MKTEGTQFCFLFHAAKRRGVVARFEGGRISSDAGGLLLREVEKRTEIVKRLASCFRDHREAGRTEHRVEELVGQRVYALALGYEDLNDHEELRRDPLLALLAGKEDLTGEERVRARDTGNPLAGKSTLNRLELTRATVAREERYKKIALDTEAVDRALVEVFLEAHREAPPGHCHVNRVGPQRPAWIPFQAAALALSHTLNASFRNRLNVSLLRKCRWT